MFKKLKDKLTEEVKIPSQKFTQSMQQLAQAVVSPVSSANSTFDTASNDNFSIDGDFDDTPQGSPVKPPASAGGVAYRGGLATPIRNSFDTGSGAGFTHVDLHQGSGTPKMPASLRSSVSSLASDSFFMFPVLESSGPTYNFQSDLESCSEASESVGPNINKEQLVLAYQKIQQKYHKYKGRYEDLARHYRDLERDNKNAKNILSESQDKALRRMAELKEQCNLEKQAKAHLEEALRSDLEEKDHLIHTLKTKIKLLRNQSDQVPVQQADENPPRNESSAVVEEKSEFPGVQEDLLTGTDNGPGYTPAVGVLTPEPANVESENALKEKLKKLESLLHKCKEDITNKRENIKQLESDKHAANEKVQALQQQLITIQKREEEASLSLAKNKQTIHQELESKEDVIKKLNAQLTASIGRVTELQAEIVLIKEESKKELASSKAQVMKLMKTEVEGMLSQKKSLEELLATRDSELKTQEDKLAELLKRLEKQEAELGLMMKFKEEREGKHNETTKLLNAEIFRLQSNQNSEGDGESKKKKLMEVLDSLKALRGFHEQLKCDVTKGHLASTDLFNQQAALIQERIAATMTGFTIEHQNVLSELADCKRESLNAKESLVSVNSQLAHLQQCLSSEKSEMEAKISTLLKELNLNEKQISTLEQNLASERENHQLTLNEYSEKLAVLQKKLGQEKAKSKEYLQGSSSVEMTMKSTIDELIEQVKKLEQEKKKAVSDFLSVNERANTLQMTSEQLQQELEIFKTRDRESMNEMTSMRMLLDKKNMYVETLESCVSELESKVQATVTEKQELEQKWSSLEAELMSQISEIKTKHQEATDIIKDLEEKDSLKADDTVTKISSLEREKEVKDTRIAELQNCLCDKEAELEKTITINTEFQKERDDLVRKYHEQESVVVHLRETNEILSQSVKHLQDDQEKKAGRLQDLESSGEELQKITSENLEQANRIAIFEENLITKGEECDTLKRNLEKANACISELQESLMSKTSECDGLVQDIEILKLAHSEQSEVLQEKSEECMRLTSEVEGIKDQISQVKLTFEQKTKECELLQTYQYDMEKNQSTASEEDAKKREECDELKVQISHLESENLELTQALQGRKEEMEKVASALQSVGQEFAKQSNVLEAKVQECSDLTSKLDSLTAEYEKTVQQLKQITIECEDKEAQLDNLADEMKRVEELSQELHRINDDRDANVEVLSSEASSLAQKVEELTITTQELKEREVDLLAKLEIAQDLEAEYISMKSKEEKLLSELKELQANEQELSIKTLRIEELMEENRRLKEAGENLNEIINRAKEAEAKCEKLQNDGAELLLRIQKAEESENRCSLLEEELDTIKKEKAKLTQQLEMIQHKTVVKEVNSDENGVVDHKDPVIEEPCVVKHYADLTESNHGLNGDDWEEKYTKLLEQYNMALQENEKLKEENLLTGMVQGMKKKERLWDHQESAGHDGSSNSSLGTVEKLQQQLATVTSQLQENKKVHRQEVDDLRRILLNHGSRNSHVSSRSDNLEDATELEYLRNILFEYMMGKEPMILARVIAAVVKFDSEQTSKVLQKEQQRLSLLGHLGIS